MDALTHNALAGQCNDILRKFSSEDEEDDFVWSEQSTSFPAHTTRRVLTLSNAGKVIVNKRSSIDESETRAMLVPSGATPNLFDASCYNRWADAVSSVALVDVSRQTIPLLKEWYSIGHITQRHSHFYQQGLTPPSHVHKQPLTTALAVNYFPVINTEHEGDVGDAFVLEVIQLIGEDPEYLQSSILEYLENRPSLVIRELCTSFFTAGNNQATWTFINSLSRLRDEGNVEIIKEAAIVFLSHTSAGVRNAAANLLGEIRSADALNALSQQAGKETNPFVKATLQAYL